MRKDFQMILEFLFFLGLGMIAILTLADLFFDLQELPLLMGIFLSLTGFFYAWRLQKFHMSPFWNLPYLKAKSVLVPLTVGFCGIILLLALAYVYFF
jgi:uncharacterized membrane protein HdeD (DUF308 family)